MNKTVLILITVLLMASPPLARAAAPGQALYPPTAAPAGDLVVMTEGFEGAWPATGWTVTDLNTTNSNDIRWGRDNYRSQSGSWAAWPAAGGANGVQPVPRIYPDDVETRMSYGPIDLSNAISAKVNYWLWYDIHVVNDVFSFGISTDGTRYMYVEDYQGSSEEWVNIEVDLAEYLGNSAVWLGWYFYSDESAARQGVFIDNITVTKTILGTPAVSIKRSGTNKTNVTLTWNAVAGATGYEIWWGVNAPYFTPGTNCAGTPGSCIALGSSTSLELTGASGSVDSNYSYRVYASKGTVRSAPSNRVAEFDFKLVPGG